MGGVAAHSGKPCRSLGTKAQSPFGQVALIMHVFPHKFQSGLEDRLGDRGKSSLFQKLVIGQLEIVQD